MKKLEFTKMEGIGNDYIYIDATKENIQLTKEEIIKLSDRNFGIGGDGVIFIRPSKTGDFQMDMFNADGSSSEMCGNGIRCVGKFIYDHGLTSKLTPVIETGKGLLTLHLFPQKNSKISHITVDMGDPIFKPSLIPLDLPGEGPILEQRIDAGDQTFLFTAVSMGNPHCVILVEDAEKFPVREIGPLLENHPLFPRRVNVEFVHLVGKDHLYQRTWERGSGETLACGTGACAVAVAFHLNHRTGRKVEIDLRGGRLSIEWRESGNVMMTGPAKEIFSGAIELES